MTAELEKVERKAAKIVRNSKQKEARKWEAKGKSTITKWLSSSISKRDDRKENPDRDKARRKLNCLKAECLATQDASQSRSIWTILCIMYYGPAATWRWKPNLRGHDPQGVTLRRCELS